MRTHFAETAAEAAASFLRSGAVDARRDEAPFRGFLDELERYTAGERVTWMTPFCIEVGTEFQRRVWQRLAGVPYGSTLTYGGLARLARHPRGARAVGNACGKNPLPLRIPCHRVIAAAGIGGFSSDPRIKARLLAQVTQLRPNLC